MVIRFVGRSSPTSYQASHHYSILTLAQASIFPYLFSIDPNHQRITNSLWKMADVIFKRRVPLSTVWQQEYELDRALAFRTFFKEYLLIVVNIHDPGIASKNNSVTLLRWLQLFPPLITRTATGWVLYLERPLSSTTSSQWEYCVWEGPI